MRVSYLLAGIGMMFAAPAGAAEGDLNALVAAMDAKLGSQPGGLEYQDYELWEDTQQISYYLDAHGHYSGGVYPTGPCVVVTPQQGSRWLAQDAMRILEVPRSGLRPYALAFQELSQRLEIPHEMCPYELDYADDPWSGTSGVATVFQVPGTQDVFMFVESYTWVE